MSNGILLRREKICFCFFLEDNNKRLILDLNNVYYLSNKFCNFINLIYLNDNNIYHDNKNRTLYYIKIRKILAQTIIKRTIIF